MAKICYVNTKFHQTTLDIIKIANNIIEKYQAQDMLLTVRQIYYQFIGKDLFPDSWIDENYNIKNGLPLDTKNTEKNYGKLANIISKARDSGYLDWSAIEDRTRRLQIKQHWNDPGEIIRAAAYSFRLNHWEGQEYYIEVWIEKEALVGVIEPICSKLDIGYFACKGFVSQSSMWKASQRLKNFYDSGIFPIIIHLGDHDPSGLDMTRDIYDRQGKFYCPVIVKRIALNMDQIKIYNPPPNPAKITDTRAKKYIKKYGKDSWELDALEPYIIKELIEGVVLEYRNEDIYQETIKKEQEYLSILQRVEENWETL